MKRKITIPVAVGFCKKCFKMRRHGSAYCGECQDEPERFSIYQDSTLNFPMLEKVMKKFNLKNIDLDKIIFTYGDTIYFDKDLSYGLIAHEITHVFQQINMGSEIWWGKYLKSKKFRLSQEVEAYQNQYKAYVRKNIGEFELERLATDLSGVMYGSVIGLDKAKKLIMEGK
jgi:hypothetical protein